MADASFADAVASGGGAVASADVAVMASDAAEATGMGIAAAMDGQAAPSTSDVARVWPSQQPIHVLDVPQFAVPAPDRY